MKKRVSTLFVSIITITAMLAVLLWTFDQDRKDIADSIRLAAAAYRAVERDCYDDGKLNKSSLKSDYGPYGMRESASSTPDWHSRITRYKIVYNEQGAATVEIAYENFKTDLLRNNPTIYFNGECINKSLRWVIDTGDRNIPAYYFWFLNV